MRKWRIKGETSTDAVYTLGGSVCRTLHLLLSRHDSLLSSTGASCTSGVLQEGLHLVQISF